jgi:hypothetical protein
MNAVNSSTHSTYSRYHIEHLTRQRTLLDLEIKQSTQGAGERRRTFASRHIRLLIHDYRLYIQRALGEKRGFETLMNGAGLVVSVIALGMSFFALRHDEESLRNAERALAQADKALQQGERALTQGNLSLAQSERAVEIASRQAGISAAGVSTARKSAPDRTKRRPSSSTT